MEKIEEVPSVDIVHRFYCDECQKLLMESFEYDDGYYSEPRSLNKRIQIENKKFVYCKVLCEDCANKVNERFKEKILDNEELKKIFLDFGFEEEKH